MELGLSPHLQLLNLGSSSSETMVREHSPSLFLSIFERFGNSGSLQEPVRPISYKTQTFGAWGSVIACPCPPIAGQGAPAEKRKISIFLSGP